MKVAYIGNFGPEWSTENDVRKAFEHLGWEVAKLQEDCSSWEDVRREALGSDLLLITSSWDDAQPLNETIETIRLCGMQGIPSATLHLDVFHGSDRGARRWWMNPMFSTAYVFTASGDYDDTWKKMGVNHIWLPPAVRHDAVHEGKYRDEYDCDVAFVGSCGIGYHEAAWPYRKQLVDKLRELCTKNGWSFRNPGGEFDKPDAGKIPRGEDMNDFYRSAKVTVGDSLCLLKKRSKYYSDRAVEAPGRYGLLIMPQINALDDLYESKLPMYTWGDWSDLEKKIKYYLDNADVNEQVRKETHEIAMRNTYVQRVQTILKTVGLSDE